MRTRYTLISLLYIICLSCACTALHAQDYSLRTVVLDPGHGGKDAGAVSKDRKTYEKNLVLKISKLIGAKINAKYGNEVKVLYTRDKDVFVPLASRADFANHNHADLFISVHINSATSTKPSGHSVHILGPSSNPNNDLVAGNLDVCKRENSVIMLEDDYNTTYQGFDPNDDASYIFMTLMQSAHYEQSVFFASLAEEQLDKGPIKVKRGVEQDPFYVLWKTAMPSVLLELGFISNESDLAILRSEEQCNRIAERIFQAFCTYKKHFDSSVNF